jgi:multidrug efflux pump subunit AcrA (membrane-fusion protein)
MPSLVRRLPLPKRPTIVVNVVLGALVLGGGAWAYTSIWQSSANASTNNSTTRTVAVTQGTVTASATADGTVQSANTATADFETSGTVTEIRVKVGDVVKKGAVLAKVDPAAAQRTLNRAEADLDAAEDALSRAEDADQDTSDAEAEVTQAKLDVADAQSGVDGTVLTAPMAGTVVAVNGTVGGSSGGGSNSSSSSGSNGSSGGANAGGGSTNSSSSSSSGSGFIEIQDLSKLEVSASFAEADATKIKVGQAATVTWNALSGTRVTGKVTTIDPSATTSNNVVSYGVTISLDSMPAGAKPGQTTSVEVVTGEVSDAVRVPAQAVTTAGGRKSVTVVENGVSTRTVVEVGLEGDTFTEIKSGLTAGQQVAITISSSSSNSNFLPGGGAFPGGGLTGGGAFPGGGTNGGGQRTTGGR